jgi:O-antigen/teichoic acid export membrane protein
VQAVRTQAVSTGWGLVAELVRLPTALVVFLLLTRRYDKSEWGVLVGTLSVLMFLLPYATAGSSYLLLQRVAGDRWPPRRALEHAFGMVLVGGTVFGSMMVVFRPVVLPQVPVGTLVLLCLSEVIAAGQVEALVFLTQAQERLEVMAAVRAVAGFSRVGAALALVVLTRNPPLWMWAALALGCSVLTTLVGQFFVLGGLVRPQIPNWEEVRRGVPFALGFGADKFRDGIDTWLLLRLNRPGDSGIYGAAARIVSMGAAPVSSIIAATNARFFAAANVSVLAVRRLAQRVTAAAFSYGLVVAGAFWLIADLLVRVLPPSYAETGSAMRLMGLFPAIGCLEFFAGMGLTAIGRHRTRVMLNLATAGLNAILDLLWIPRFGYRAAIVATIIAGMSYSACLWWVLQRAVQRDRLGQRSVS